MRKRTIANIIAFFVLWLVIVSAAIMAFFPTVRVYVSTHFVALVADVFITYNYYGEELSSLEIYEMNENGDDLHCIQVPTETSDRLRFANQFECFNTLPETEAFAP